MNRPVSGLGLALAVTLAASASRAGEPRVTGIKAFCRDGQVFVTWKDAAEGQAGSKYRYSVYRSDAPITQANLAGAAPVIRGILNNSCKLLGLDLTTKDRLDPAKWHDHNPQWKGRQPGLFSRSNVTVRDGALHLTARAEDLPNLPDGYHTFTTAAVKSKALVKYGYFEIRCRPMKSRASSAFWFYHSTPEIWTEIDVFEIGSSARSVATTA